MPSMFDIHREHLFLKICSLVCTLTYQEVLIFNIIVLLREDILIWTEKLGPVECPLCSWRGHGDGGWSIAVTVMIQMIQMIPPGT